MTPHPTTRQEFSDNDTTIYGKIFLNYLLLLQSILLGKIHILIWLLLV